MKRIPVHHLDPGSGTPGQVATIGPLGNRVVYADPATGATLAWFNVRDYGATGSGSVDDTAAINAAIAAVNANGGGVLYFPTGIYKITGALTALTGPTTVIGDGCADSHFRQAATTVRLSSNTAVMFTVGSAAHGTKFAGLNLINNSGSTPTTGAAIQVLGGDGARYEELTIAGFWINMDMQDGQEWTMEQCFLYSPVKYAMKIQHIDLVDGGDMGITNCQFLAGDYNADAAIRWETGGGLRLTNCKINTRTLSHFFGIGLDAAITATTGVLVVQGNSFENVTGPCIRGTLTAFHTFQGATISGNEFAYYFATSASAIDIGGWNAVEIGPNIGIAQGGGSSGPMVKLTTCTNGKVGLNAYDGFASEYTLTTCTNIAAGVVPTSRQVATGTGLNGGGDLSADRTLAIDLPAEAERIRDVAGAALVQGAGVTITVDDAGDTITIASTATSGLRPLTTESGGVPDLVWDDNNDLVMTEAT